MRRAGPLDPIVMSSKLSWIVSGNSGGGSNCSVVDSLESNDTLVFDLENFGVRKKFLIKLQTYLLLMNKPVKTFCQKPL